MGGVISSNTVEQRKAYLKRTPFFLLASQIESSKLLDELAALSKLKRLKAGATLDKVQRSTFIVVCEGELVHTLSAPSAPTSDGPVIARRKPGDFFRLFESDFLSKMDRVLGSVQIKATQKTLLLLLSPAAINTVIAQAEGRRRKKREAAGEEPDTTKVNHVEMQFKTMLDALKQDLTQQLAKVPCFTPFSPKQRAVLAELFSFEILDANTELFAQGSTGTSFFILVEGKLDIFALEQDGKSSRIAQLTPVAFLGEIALLYACPRTCSVRSLDSACALLSLSKDHFNALLVDSPDLRSTVEAEQRGRMVATFLVYSGLTPADKLSQDLCKDIARWLTVREVPQGATVISQGQPALGYMMVFQGDLQASGVDGVTGDTPVLYSPGAHFGGVDMLLNRPALHSVTATTSCLLLEAKGRNFFELLQHVPILKYEFQLRVMGSSLPLDAVLHHPACFEAFREFQRAEYAEESTLFYLAVQEFKDMASAVPEGAPDSPEAMEVKAQAKALVDMYVIDNSDRCVNLPSAVATKCAKAVEAGEITASLFDDSLNEILSLMSKDTLFRFKRDERYSALRQKLRSADQELEKFDLNALKEAWIASAPKEEATPDGGGSGVASPKRPANPRFTGQPNPRRESALMELKTSTMTISSTRNTERVTDRDDKTGDSQKSKAKYTAKVAPEDNATVSADSSNITWATD
ncbi:hypothetical protein AB1Y20_019901 [Prymnesium parvum]|uniref:Cyclic nucleotide-binding domain-containing protein n=1 Tax=Prymnesium parvum TaxID=97485 RepID=A0AB34JVT6_PRYPA